jgi:ketosteroid isomerase-like protein
VSDEDAQLARQAYEAWNRGDLDWVLDRVAPDFVFQTAHVLPDTERTYRGREGFMRFWKTLREPWESLLIEVERIQPIGEHEVLALLQFQARGRDGVAATLEYAHLITIEEGVISRLVGFASWNEALEAAGLAG